jgi:hypothetical protein
MPAVICYVTGPGGREVQLRVRASGRAAIPLSDLPDPLPRELKLVCGGMLIELKLADEPRFGLAAYYMSAVDFDRLVMLVRQHCREPGPCRLPCSLLPA